MAPIGPEHQFILETLNEIFGMQKEGRFKVGPGRPIPIPDFNEPQPDMVLFKTEGGTRRQHASPQEIYLVIEVSDTTIKYDSGKKLHAYENAASVSGCFGPTGRYFLASQLSQATPRRRFSSR
jgi:Putative restriction endonuclease